MARDCRKPKVDKSSGAAIEERWWREPARIAIEGIVSTAMVGALSYIASKSKATWLVDNWLLVLSIGLLLTGFIELYRALGEVKSSFSTLTEQIRQSAARSAAEADFVKCVREIDGGCQYTQLTDTFTVDWREVHARGGDWYAKNRMLVLPKGMKIHNETIKHVGEGVRRVLETWASKLRTVPTAGNDLSGAWRLLLEIYLTEEFRDFEGGNVATNCIVYQALLDAFLKYFILQYTEDAHVCIFTTLDMSSWLTEYSWQGSKSSELNRERYFLRDTKDSISAYKTSLSEFIKSADSRARQCMFERFMFVASDNAHSDALGIPSIAWLTEFCRDNADLVQTDYVDALHFNGNHAYYLEWDKVFGDDVPLTGEKDLLCFGVTQENAEDWHWALSTKLSPEHDVMLVRILDHKQIKTSQGGFGGKGLIAFINKIQQAKTDGKYSGLITSLMPEKEQLLET